MKLFNSIIALLLLISPLCAQQRITSGNTTQSVYVKMVSSTDHISGVTGLTSGSFTIYRSRNGGTATAMTTPTVVEVEATNMPGVYKLLCDEDTTVTSGANEDNMVFHFSATGADKAVVAAVIVRPTVTAGQTATISSGGVSVASGGIASTAFVAGAITAESIELDAITSSKIATGAIDADAIATGAIVNGTEATGFGTAQTGDCFARLGAPTGASISADLVGLQADVSGIDGTTLTIASTTGNILTQTGTTGVVLATDAITAAKIAPDAIGASEIAAGAIVKGTELTGLNDISSTDVNTEMVDVIWNDANTEPGTGAPPATTNIGTKLSYIYKLMRNRITQTTSGATTTMNVYDDAGTTVQQKAVMSDNGTTFDRGEIVTGP